LTANRDVELEWSIVICH